MKHAFVLAPGDFNTVPERHLAGASIPRLRPDLLITESTYATSIRQDRRSRETYLLNLVSVDLFQIVKIVTQTRKVL